MACTETRHFSSCLNRSEIASKKINGCGDHRFENLNEELRIVEDSSDESSDSIVTKVGPFHEKGMTKNKIKEELGEALPPDGKNMEKNELKTDPKMVATFNNLIDGVFESADDAVGEKKVRPVEPDRNETEQTVPGTDGCSSEACESERNINSKEPSGGEVVGSKRRLVKEEFIDQESRPSELLEKIERIGASETSAMLTIVENSNSSEDVDFEKVEVNGELCSEMESSCSEASTVVQNRNFEACESIRSSEIDCDISNNIKSSLVSSEMNIKEKSNQREIHALSNIVSHNSSSLPPLKRSKSEEFIPEFSTKKRSPSLHKPKDLNRNSKPRNCNSNSCRFSPETIPQTKKLWDYDKGSKICSSISDKTIDSEDHLGPRVCFGLALLVFVLLISSPICHIVVLALLWFHLSEYLYSVLS